MKLIAFVAGIICALAGTTCQASLYTYQDGQGYLKLSVSEETGDPVVTIRTSNPGTCELVTEGCALSEDGLTCFTADGYPVVIKYGFNHTLKVTSVPAHLCGLYGTATGVYQLKH